MKKGYRGLEKKSGLLEKLSVGGSLHEVIETVKQNNDYWLGIRDNQVMVYFMGGKILEISEGGALSFVPKYIKHYNGRIMNKSFSNIKEWLSYLCLLRTSIYAYQNTYKKTEKMVQQEFMHKNNQWSKSDWFLVDMEYAACRCPCGRFDMIAISKKKTDGKHQIALIELKSGTHAFGGTKAKTGNYGSGIAGHIHNFYEFLFGGSAQQNINRLAKEIALILSNCKLLGLDYGGLQIDEAEIDTNPQNIKCIILCSNIENNEEAVCQMKKYIFKSNGASKYCLENLWGGAFNQKMTKMNLFASVVNKERTIDSSTFKIIKR